MADEQFLTAVLQLKDKNFTAGLRQGSSGLDKFRRGVNKAGDGVDKFGRGTVSSFKTVGHASSSLTKTIVGLGTAILGLKAVGLAKDQLLGSIDEASSLESYRLTLNTVMKDTKKAGEIMKWASQFANITPFETSEVIEGTVRLQSYGIEAKKSMGSIGDMAAVMNKDLMQAIEAVADAQTGELERMKEFGITKGMIQDKADKMFKGKEIINKKGQITDQKKFNEAMFALMDERFKGGMEKQATTFKGITSTITGTWKTGLAEMMGVTADGTIRQGSMFEKLKKKADEVSKRFQTWANDGTFKKLGDKASSMVSKFEEKIPAIKQFFVDLKTPMQIVGDILKDMGTGFNAIVKFANEHPDIAKAIGLTAVGVVVAKKTGVLDLGKGIVNTVSKTVGGGGTQNIKAAVVNVFGAKINGGTGGVVGDVAKKGGVLGWLAAFGKGAGKFGGNVAKEAMTSKSLMMMAATDAYSGTTEKSQELGAKFIYENMKKDGFNVIDPALNDKNINLPISQRGYSTAKYGESPKLLQELNMLSSAIAQQQNRPSQVSINLNGGITVREEADIDKIAMKILAEIKKQYGNVTASMTSIGGYSMARR